MNHLDPIRLAASRSFLQEAFNHASGVNDPSSKMALRLLQDIRLIEGIVTVSEMSDTDGNMRDRVVGLMDWPAVKSLGDRTNHLTSPELYSRLRIFDPHMAEAYMKLKWSMAQLELAVYPPKSAYEAESTLAEGPIVR